MILGENGEKMSKSRGNVVNPDDIVAEFGADTLRTYEMFIGAFDLSASWSQEGVKGCRRFLERVWKLQDSLVDGDSYSKELESKMHQTIKKVSSDYESLKYNTAIAAMMTLVNEFYKAGKVTRKEFETASDPAESGCTAYDRGTVGRPWIRRPSVSDRMAGV